MDNSSVMESRDRQSEKVKCKNQRKVIAKEKTFFQGRNSSCGFE